jgi:hypothetical protein
LHGAAKNRQFMIEEASRNKEPNIIPGMDVEHRLNSTFDLLVQALRITNSLSSLSNMLLRENKNIIFSRIEKEDWDSFLLIKEFLEPFKQGKKQLLNTFKINFT